MILPLLIVLSAAPTLSRARRRTALISPGFNFTHGLTLDARTEDHHDDRFFIPVAEEGR